MGICSKMTGIELKLLTDISVLLDYRNSITKEISKAICRLAKCK